MQVRKIDSKILKAATLLLQDGCPELSPVNLVDALRKYTPGKREYLTVAQVAERFHVTTKTVKNWMADGRLVAHKMGGTVVISTDDLNAMMVPLGVGDRAAVDDGQQLADDVQG